MDRSRCSFDMRQNTQHTLAIAVFLSLSRHSSYLPSRFYSTCNPIPCFLDPRPYTNKTYYDFLVSLISARTHI